MSSGNKATVGVRRRSLRGAPGAGWRAVRRAGLGLMISVSTLGGLLLAAFFAPLPYQPDAIDLNNTLKAPSGAHWFGTDAVGHDVFSRVIVAARTDLPLVLAGTAAALVVGVVAGLIVSVKSKWSERGMRGLDIFQSFPVLILSMVIVTLAGNSIGTLVVAVAIVYAPRFTRLVRAQALAIRESRYIEAATAIGASRFRIVTRHILPNVTGVILVQTALTASRVILVIAALSYLGIGIRPPTASWGAMIESGAQSIVTGQWWLTVFPGMAIFICVIMFLQIASALEVLLGRGARG